MRTISTPTSDTVVPATSARWPTMRHSGSAATEGDCVYVRLCANTPPMMARVLWFDAATGYRVVSLSSQHADTLESFDLPLRGGTWCNVKPLECSACGSNNTWLACTTRCVPACAMCARRLGACPVCAQSADDCVTGDSPVCQAERDIDGDQERYVRLYVANIGSGWRSVSVCTRWSVRLFCAAMRRQCGGVSMHDLRIYRACMQLQPDDDRTLAQCGIVDRDMVRLLLRLRGD